MPLAMAAEGETRTITDFRGQEDMKRHLRDLGFMKGERVRVVGENAGVKVALNRGLAHKIMVAD